MLSDLAGLRAQAESQLGGLLDLYAIGIEPAGLEVQSLGFPSEVAKAREALRQAQEEAPRRIDAAVQAAELARANAKAEGESLVADARAAAARRIEAAKAEAERFDQLLDQYRRDPQTVRQTLYLQTLRRLMPAAARVIIEDASPSPAPAAEEAIR